MSFVIYHKETTQIYTYTRRNPWRRVESYATMPAAKAAFTRLAKKGEVNDREWTIADQSLFHELIEKQVVRRNLITGAEFTEPANTPYYCSPSSETYWSM